MWICRHVQGKPISAMTKRPKHAVRDTLRVILAVTGVSASAAPLIDQSSGPEGPTVGGLVIGANVVGQTFRPSLGSLDFVQVQGVVFPDAASAISRVVLRADGESGSLLAASAPLFIADGAVQSRTYLFETPVALTPGDRYYFGMELVSAGSPATEMVVSIIDHGDPYPGGDLIVNGFVNPGMDLWFREGVTIPEPSIQRLLGLGAIAAGIAGARQRLRIRTSRG